MKMYISKEKKVRQDVVIVFILVILPFLFYSYVLLPNNDAKIWSYKFITIDSGYYNDVFFYAWLVSTKILTLLILSIWYVTSNEKWKKVLLLCVFLEILKVSINIDYANHDIIKNAFLNSIITFVPYALILNFLSKKYNFEKNKQSISKLLNNEINDQLEKISKYGNKNIKNLRKEFKELKKNKKKNDKRKYLKELILLKDSLNNINSSNP